MLFIPVVENHFTKNRLLLNKEIIARTQSY
jgi:hypothetical protein